MESSERSRGHCLIEEDQGLVSIAIMEAEYSGTHYQTHNQNEFSQRPLCYSRRISLKNPSPYSSSCSSSRSAIFEDYNQLSFLDVCFLCKEPLGSHRDIFTYRGGMSFCSEECRQGQLDIEETMEKSNSLPSSMRAQENPPPVEGFQQLLALHSVLKITSLCISDINYLSSLPPLGLLPVLEHLLIQRIGGVKSIGPDFHTLGSSFRKPFQSLKTLKFEAMPLWGRWIPLEIEVEEFPCLLELYIIDCPKLVGDLPKRLSSLTKLEIYECQQLTVLIPLTSQRCVLNFKNCYKVQNRIDDNQTMSSSIQFSSSVVQQEQDDTQTRTSTSPDGNQQFSSSAKKLRFERYASDMLPKEILDRSSLQQLDLIDCIPLKVFPVSPSLKDLYIRNCKSLEFPQPKEQLQMNQLEFLSLSTSCDSLQTLPLNYFRKLVSVNLCGCKNLECIYMGKEVHNELINLDYFEIADCPKLRSFLEDEFQAPNLKTLCVNNCGSLKSLQLLQSLESLRALCISKCPALESFPMEGLPSGLSFLSMSSCDKLTPHKGWKLDKLHFLDHFQIQGGCKNLESFPEEGLLPTNLKVLCIDRISNLTSLDGEGLQKLTSLRALQITKCKKLDSLPELRLPSSLDSLWIKNCSLLNPKLRNKRGDEWSKIAHVPSIHIDVDTA